MNDDHILRRGDDHLPSPSARAYSFPKTDLGCAASTWLADGRAQGWSPRTVESRTYVLRQFLWWIETVEGLQPLLGTLTPHLLRSFMAYSREPQSGGRYGSEHRMAGRTARPSTVQTYYSHLRAFFNFCIAEGLPVQKPLRNVKPPRVPTEQVQPFSPEQVQALLNAARGSEEKDRNRAVLLLLVDAGLRVSELCALRVNDVDRSTGQISVLGKGNKRRTVYTGATARRAVTRYLQTRRPNARPDEPLFHADGHLGEQQGLTPNGVRLMMRRLGRAAGIQGVRISPHTARHTFAVSFLRAGGNLFELQALMGHTDLTILRRYVALAQSDPERAHRQASPADRMKLRLGAGDRSVATWPSARALVDQALSLLAGLLVSPTRRRCPYPMPVGGSR